METGGDAPRAVGGVAVEAVRERVAGRGPLVDRAPRPAQLLRAGPRRRPRRGRLPRGAQRPLVPAAGLTMSYVELHAHSAFSFLDGASTPAELAAAAARLGYPAFALTDHDGVWGSMEFAQACRDLGLRPITGAELTLEGGAHLTLLVETAAGYRNLCRLLTAAHSHTRDGRRRLAGRPWTTLERVEEHGEGLVCLSGCARDGALAGAWERGEAVAAAALAQRLLRAFGRERFRVELQRPSWRRDRARNRWLARPGRAARRGDRRHRQRPLPRRLPQPAPGRLRRGPPRHHPGGLRELAPRQLELGPRLPGGDGGALRRAPGGARRDRAPGRAAALRPDRAARLPLPRLGGPGRRPQAGRDLPGAARAALRRARHPRRGGGTARGGAGDDPQARPLRLLPPPPRAARAGPRGRARGARPRVGALDPAAGAGEGLERQLDRLLPDRPLPHRPGRETPLHRPLPQR